MEALPEDRLGLLEETLEGEWYSVRFGRRRGAIACSWGLLGLRWAECEAMRYQDLGEDSRSVRVRTAKGGADRRIEAPMGLLVATLRMRRFVPSEYWGVFVRSTGKAATYQDIRRYVKSVTSAVFGRAYSFHCFRHTAAVRVYTRTGDVLAVQRYLGHASLRWTATYLMSLTGVDVGGPVAFSGERANRRLRVFDPGGGTGQVVTVADTAEVRKPEETAPRPCYRSGAGEHECQLEELRPLPGRRAVCTVCGSRWEWGPGETAEDAFKSESRRDDLERERARLEDERAAERAAAEREKRRAESAAAERARAEAMHAEALRREEERARRRAAIAGCRQAYLF